MDTNPEMLLNGGKVKQRVALLLARQIFSLQVTITISLLNKLGRGYGYKFPLWMVEARGLETLKGWNRLLALSL